MFKNPGHLGSWTSFKDEFVGEKQILIKNDRASNHETIVR